MINRVANLRFSRKSNPESLSEQDAVALLTRYFYCGTPKRYLGWRFADSELQPDGAFVKKGKDRWESWKTPQKIGKQPDGSYKSFQPVWDHLKGLNRGIVSDGETPVAYFTVERDRHFSDVDSETHILESLQQFRALKHAYPQLCIWTEINRENGSIKFFLFFPGLRLFTYDSAYKAAESLASKFDKSRGECFPFNCKQVGLPCRHDKITLGPLGEIQKTTRKKKINGRFIKFQAYSAKDMIRQLQHAGAPDEAVIETLLREACLKPLPERATPRKAVSKAPKKVRKKQKTEGNALTRIHSFGLELSRKLRRPATSEEILNGYQVSGLYSGEWQDGVTERKQRAAWSAKRVAKTFDLAKCGQGKSTKPELLKRLKEADAHLWSHLSRKYSKRQVYVTPQQHKTIICVIQHVGQDRQGYMGKKSILGWLKEFGITKEQYYVVRRYHEKEAKDVKIDHRYTLGQAKTCEFECRLVGTIYSYPHNTAHLMVVSARRSREIPFCEKEERQTGPPDG